MKSQQIALWCWLRVCLILVLSFWLFILVAAPAQGQTVIASVPVGEQPLAVALNPVTNKIYVAKANGNNVTVIDGATNSTTTVTDPNATFPVAVAVNAVTNKVYVVNVASNNVTVIDGLSHTTTTVTDPNAIFPVAVAVNPVTNKIYVANEGDSCPTSETSQ
jgi:DNA-binding beta-propeller fold protein YncE